jgi:hypothetical protein
LSASFRPTGASWSRPAWPTAWSFLERFGFSAEELDWLEANLGLDPATLDALA